MTDRILELVFAHDKNPVQTIAALLTVAAMMATRLRLSDQEWQAATTAAWAGNKAKWADYDRGKS